MKVFTGIIMLLGLIIGFIILTSAKSSAQEVVALVPMIGGYITARMFENFSTSDEKRILKLLEKNLLKEETKKEVEK